MVDLISRIDQFFLHYDLSPIALVWLCFSMTDGPFLLATLRALLEATLSLPRLSSTGKPEHPSLLFSSPSLSRPRTPLFGPIVLRLLTPRQTCTLKVHHPSNFVRHRHRTSIRIPFYTTYIDCQDNRAGHGKISQGDERPMSSIKHRLQR